MWHPETRATLMPGPWNPPIGPFFDVCGAGLVLRRQIATVGRRQADAP
jgi:hypothetical protein